MNAVFPGLKTGCKFIGWRGMHDRPSKESAGEQYRRLAQACLEIVPSIQDGGGREALIEMARVWLRLAESYAEASSTTSAAAGTQQQHQQLRSDRTKIKI
jgi:hypothetical protein